MGEHEPTNRPERRDPFRLAPSEQLAKLREVATRLAEYLDAHHVDLDAPVHPLVHMDTGKRLAEVVIRSAALIADLGLDPEFMVSLKIAELTRAGTEGHAGA